METRKATLTGGHPEEAERLVYPKATTVRGPIVEPPAPMTYHEAQRTTARTLAEDAADWTGLALANLHHDPALAALYARLAQAAALASLALQKAYRNE